MSNELITSTKENTISSREVAEMIGIRHDHMLDKIDKLNSILNNRNLGASKYWYETTHKQRFGNGKFRSEANFGLSSERVQF